MKLQISRAQVLQVKHTLYLTPHAGVWITLILLFLKPSLQVGEATYRETPWPGPLVYSGEPAQTQALFYRA
jgi:hypothetical protein